GGSKLAFYQNSAVAPVAASPNTGGSGTAGTANNLLTVLGSLGIDPSVTYLINGDYNSFPDHGATYSFQVASATTIPIAVNVTNQAQFDTTSFANYVAGAYVFSLQSVGGAVYFNLQPTPEPSLLLALCAAGAGAASWAARRRRGRGAEKTGALS